MSTSTMERPVAPAARANGEAFRATLDVKTSMGIGDRMRSVARRLRARLRQGWEALRGSTVGTALGAGYNSARSLLGRVFAPVRAIGALNILGALLSCQAGRDLVRRSAANAARIITAPFRFLGRGLAWALNKFGWGKKVVTSVQGYAAKAEQWITGKFNVGMKWLDDREFSGGMRWARAYFQGRVMSGMIKTYVPPEYRTGVYIASLFVPTVGVRGGKTESKSTLLSATEARVVDEAERVVRAAADTVEPNTRTWTTVPVTVFAHGVESTAEVFIDPDGEHWMKYDGTLYSESDLPDDVLIGEKAKAAAKKARETASVLHSVAATTGGAPANRAAKRAEARAHGPVKK